jgi:voltage-gated potassium channel
MAATALRPLAVNFMELLAGSDCEVEEFQLSDDPRRLAALEGSNLADLQVGRRSGALVLAIRNPDRAHPGESGIRGAAYLPSDSRLIANPGGSEPLAPGQLLVVMGSKEQLRKFGLLLGPALIDVGSMPS